MAEGMINKEIIGASKIFFYGYHEITIDSIASLEEKKITITAPSSEYNGGYCLIFLIRNGTLFTVQNAPINSSGSADCWIRNISNATKTNLIVTYCYLLIK